MIYNFLLKQLLLQISLYIFKFVLKDAHSDTKRYGTDQDFFDPTRPVNFKIYAGLTGQSICFDRSGQLVFLRKVFVHCLMHLQKKFQKRYAMGEMLKFVTPGSSVRKNAKYFCNSILRPF